MLIPLACFMHNDYWTLFHKVTFDGPNKLIHINPGILSLNVQTDIYSDWKEWVMVRDNLKWEAALRSTGGDPLPGAVDLGATFFLINGWRIKPWQGFYSITITGNLYTEEGDSPYVPATSPAGVQLIGNVSNLIDQIDVPATNSLEDIAAEVWNTNISNLNSNTAGGSINQLKISSIAAVGTVMAGTTSSAIRTDLTNADGYFDGMTIHIVDGIDSITRVVDAYLNLNGTFILEKDAPFTPAPGSQIYVINRHKSKSGRV